ncbi:MAG: DUF2281 domain-containing protein [Gemmatimonadaceae bacterium]|jgi:hypothetical protein|nr:DUF2281 domain-containing protein [Gemmatimonadaceae bacterium]
MSEHIRDRIGRRLDALPEERLYQVLDYVEFLESKYAARAANDSLLQRFADGVEDTLRTGGIAAGTVAEAMGFLNRAVGVLNDVATKGAAVATDVVNAATRPAAPATTTEVSGTVSAPPPSAPPSAPPPPAPGARPTDYPDAGSAI